MWLYHSYLVITIGMGMFGNSHPKLAKVRSLKGVKSVKSAQVV